MRCDGLLLIYKKKGETSHDAVYKLRKKFGLDKTGHTGTLDPMAEGLLVVMLEEATKINRFLPDDKEYEAEFTFGKSTDTDDSEGKIINELPVPENLKERIQSMLAEFTGTISQVPPSYSAISKGGVRAYKLARQGKEVILEPRQVTINSIKLLSCEGNKAKFVINCSTGTYIRSLARDMGIKALTCAFMSGLKRTRVGPYSVKDSQAVDEIIFPSDRLISLDQALSHLPEYEVPESEGRLLDNGNPLVNKSGIAGGFVRLKYNKKLAAIGVVNGHEIRIERKFAA